MRSEVSSAADDFVDFRLAMNGRSYQGSGGVSFIKMYQNIGYWFRCAACGLYIGVVIHWRGWSDGLEIGAMIGGYGTTTTSTHFAIGGDQL